MESELSKVTQAPSSRIRVLPYHTPGLCVSQIFQLQNFLGLAGI